MKVLSILRNMKVMTKLLLWAFLGIMLLALTGGFALLTMRQMAASATMLYQDTTVPMEDIGHMYDLAHRIRESVLMHTIAPSAEEKQKQAEISTKTEQELQGLIAQYEARKLDDAEVRALTKFKEAWARYVQARQTVIDTSAAGEADRAREMAYAGQGNQAFAAALVQLEKAADIKEDLAQQLRDDVNNSAEKSLLIVGVMVLVFGSISAVAGITLARTISRPLGLVAGAARRLAAGDLTVAELRVSSGDEVGEMARAFNQMVPSLRNLITGVIATTQSVMASSADLSAASTQAARAAQDTAQALAQLAAGAGDQSRDTAEASHTMAQFKETIHQIATGAGESAAEAQTASDLLIKMAGAMETVAANAAGVAEGSSQATHTAKSGATVVAQTVEGMARIRQAVGESAAKITELERFSAQIGSITAAIAEIADQTNLLSLNAAIEAARAGEHGRGFAVVADEVRKLAERSARSSREISSLIDTIQSRTEQAVRSMEAGTAEVENGTKLAAEAGQSLQEIVVMSEKAAADMQKMADAVGQVQRDTKSVVEAFHAMAAITEENSAATEEMAASADQVDRSIEQVAQVSRDNAAVTQEISAAVEELTASSEEVAAAAESLEKIARSLQQQVAQFKTGA